MSDSQPTKRCSKCGADKPYGEFSPAKRGRLKLASWCRACYRERSHADKPPCPKCGEPMVKKARHCRACQRAEQAANVKACSVDGCERRHSAWGYCRMHYMRVRKSGYPGQAGPLKPPSAPRGSGHVSKHHGYRVIWRNGKGVLEHRVVMEQIMGRPLGRYESVHHLNGVRHDNRAENLELWVTPQRSGQRVTDLVQFVVEHYPEAVKAALKESESA